MKENTMVWQVWFFPTGKTMFDVLHCIFVAAAAATNPPEQGDDGLEPNIVANCTILSNLSLSGVMPTLN